MLLICCNSCVKSWRNKKKLAKNTKIKPIINKYKKEGINHPSEKDDWEKYEKDNLINALHVLYAKKEKCILSVLQVILLIIPNGERWHYLAVKKLSALWRGIMSKHCGDFYCVNSKRRRIELSCRKKISTLWRGITSKDQCDSFVWIAFIFSQQKTNINHIKKYVKIKDFVTL